MFRTDVSDAVAVLPTPPIAATPGYFSDGDPAGGVPGTVVDAAFMNMIQEELISCLTAAGISPSKTTYTQLRDSIQALISLAGGFYATDGGSANAITATLSPAPANYAALTGHSIRIKKAAAVNTGAATLNLNGLGATNIFFQGAAVLPGMLRATEIFEVVYDGTQFELVDPAAPPDKYASDTGSANAMVAGLAISPGALSAGLLVAINAAANNSGATTLNLNSLGVKNVKLAAAALTGGEILSGRTYWLEYDGTQWQLLNPSSSTTGFVTTARTISAGGIATGGGDLSANRTITVTKASSADVLTGTDDTKAITPLALAGANLVPLEGSVGWTPGTISGGGTASTSISVPGAVLGDYVLLSFSNDTAGAILHGRVSSADTVTVVLENHTGGSVTPGAGTARARVFHHA